ncbi:MAG: hypothetical protein E6R03_16735 [Hyphomicrobiaceae bacterium]|nr:MAG: hypothetical protein E6R03_16735 [Hyphomicrobiaceae bacterium]
MAGEWVKINDWPHVCLTTKAKPSLHTHYIGSIWRCECGQHYMLKRQKLSVRVLDGLINLTPLCWILDEQEHDPVRLVKLRKFKVEV